MSEDIKEIKVRTIEQQAIDNLKAMINSKDKIIEIEPPLEDTAQILLDYITNLQEENEHTNYCNEQLRKKITNLEYKINTFEDYKSRNERLNNIINEALGIANERVNYYHHINNKEMLEDWSEIFDVLVKRDKLQKLKHKKIYGSSEVEFLYFGEVGSDK